MYSTRDNCPLQCACPQFINYSPFGVWTLDLSHSGVDLTQVNRVRFHFLVSASSFAREDTVQFPVPLDECGDPAAGSWLALWFQSRLGNVGHRHPP